MPSKKKVFRKNVGLSFWTLDHVLDVFGTCYYHFLCSLDPEESIEGNYNTPRRPKHVLGQDKYIFSVWAKSNVDEAKI